MRWIGLLMVVFIVAACSQEETLNAVELTTAPHVDNALQTQTVVDTDASTNAMPNLRILRARNTLLPFHCLEAAEGEFLRITIANDGNADSDVSVIQIGEDTYDIVAIPQGEEHVIDIGRPAGISYGDEATMVIDPDNTIAESNESDNEYSFRILALTPPVRCTATPDAP